MSKILSTLGFLFTADFQHVLLIKKQRPAFHKDRLNGLGGKIENGESVLECIVREVEEETSIQTRKKDWITIGKLEWNEWNVEILTATIAEKIEDVTNLGDEDIGWYEVDNLPENIIDNLRWLIPMCIDKIRSKNLFRIEIRYN